MTQDKSHNINEQPNTSKNYGQNAINILSGLAWIVLISGIIGSIIIWATMGMIRNPKYDYIDEKIANPAGIILGFEVLFFSVITCAFLIVVCGIAGNLIAIRKNTEKQITN